MGRKLFINTWYRRHNSPSFAYFKIDYTTKKGLMK